MLKKISLFLALLALPLTMSASDGIYLGGFGGLNLLHKSHTRSHLNFKDGYSASVVGGYAFFDVLRLEVEGTYHRNNIRQIRFGERKFSCGHSRSFAAMGNFIYDIYFGYKFAPYVGFGLGCEANRLVISVPNHRFKRTRKGFARQVIAGISYPICRKVEAAIDYRLRYGVCHNLSQTISVGIKQYF